MSCSDSPSAKYSWSLPGLISVSGSTAMEVLFSDEACDLLRVSQANPLTQTSTTTNASAGMSADFHAAPCMEELSWFEGAASTPRISSLAPSAGESGRSTGLCICHRSNKAVSAFDNRFDKFGILRPVSEYFANLQYVFSENFLVYIGFRPKRLKKFGLGNQTPGVFDQMAKNIKSLRGNYYPFFSAPKAMVRYIKPERLK